MRWGVVCTQRAEKLGVPITIITTIFGSPAAASCAMASSKEHISRVHAANYGDLRCPQSVWLTLNFP